MKKIFLVLGLVITFGLLLIIFLSVNEIQRKGPQEIRSQAAPATTLAFNPNNITKYPGQTFTVDIKVNTGSNQVVSADLVIGFNPQVLQATSISIGSFLPNTSEIYKNIDNQTGLITYSFYTFATNAKSGEGTLASINFTAKAVGTGSLLFGPGTVIGALGESQSAIISMPPANYTVQTDTIPPQPLADLTVSGTTMNSVSLTWTAPADVGPEGKAQSYELRYSTSPLNATNWTSGTPAPVNPPQAPGTQESLTVPGLLANTTYYFGLKSQDLANNVSPLSNIATGKTLSKPSLTFQIKFQGILSQKPDKTVKVTLKQADTVKNTFNGVSVAANTSGTYSGTVSDIDPGVYDVYIKGWAHLQKKLLNVTLNPGSNSQDWSATILRAGDIDGSNFVNAVDIAKVIQDYFPNTPAGSVADFNLDGTVNAVDIGFLIGNYFQTGD